MGFSAEDNSKATARKRLANINAWCEEHDIAPIDICGIDYQRITLTDACGRVFHEAATNLWACDDPSVRQVIYLGTGKHHGGITLRPLFVDCGEGWCNISTGKPAPRGMLLPPS